MFTNSKKGVDGLTVSKSGRKYVTLVLQVDMWKNNFEKLCFSEGWQPSKLLERVIKPTVYYIYNEICSYVDMIQVN